MPRALRARQAFFAELFLAIFAENVYFAYIFRKLALISPFYFVPYSWSEFSNYFAKNHKKNKFSTLPEPPGGPRRLNKLRVTAVVRVTAVITVTAIIRVTAIIKVTAVIVPYSWG